MESLISESSSGRLDTICEYDIASHIIALRQAWSSFFYTNCRPWYGNVHACGRARTLKNGETVAYRSMSRTTTLLSRIRFKKNCITYFLNLYVQIIGNIAFLSKY